MPRCTGAVRNRHDIFSEICEAQYKREDVDIANFLFTAVHILDAIHRKIATVSVQCRSTGDQFLIFLKILLTAKLIVW